MCITHLKDQLTSGQRLQMHRVEDVPGSKFFVFEFRSFQSCADNVVGPVKGHIECAASPAALGTPSACSALDTALTEFVGAAHTHAHEA